jgi:hypothetical protein
MSFDPHEFVAPDSGRFSAQAGGSEALSGARVAPRGSAGRASAGSEARRVRRPHAPRRDRPRTPPCRSGRSGSDHAGAPGAAYIADRCLTGDDLSALAGSLFTAWTKWAEQQGEKPGTSTSFGRALTEAGHPGDRDEQGRRVRLGLALRGPLDGEGGA